MYEYKLETHLNQLCDKYPRYTSLNSTWTLNKRACSDLLKSVVMHYPHYSLHDASHSEAVLSKIEMLLGDRIEKLSPTDTWLLLHAAYVHDLGMVTQWKEIEAIWKQEQFQNYLKELKNSSDLEIREAAKFVLNANTEESIWPLKASRYVSLINADYFRSKHAQRSKSLLFSENSDLNVDLGHNQLVQPRLIKLLGEICALHTAPSEKILELDYKTNGFDSDYAHPRFVAMLLRLGDLLDIDNNRFNRGVELSFGQLPPTSVPHKEKHDATAHLLVTPTEICFRSNCPNSESYLEARQFVSWLEAEINFLTIYWAKIAPKDLGGYAPSFDKKELQINGVPDIQGVAGLTFQISQSKAFEIIEGSNIYDDPLVCIREIIQNALDASKIQLWRDLKSGTYNAWLEKVPEELQPYDIPEEIYQNYPIQVHISTLSDGQIQVEVTDRGTGISVDSFKRMCHVAVSNSGSEQMQNEIQGMVNWLRPTAGFGIGLQSIFLLTDHFEIDTSTGQESYHAVLYSYRTGGHVRLQRDPQRRFRGTTIRIQFQKSKHIEDYHYGHSLYYFDAFSEINNAQKMVILKNIHKYCGALFFPISINYDNFFVNLENIVNGLPKVVSGYAIWKHRYHYYLDSETGRLQLWDTESAAYAEFKFSFNKMSQTEISFKGMSVKQHIDSSVSRILVSIDIYGMNTKDCITLDRSTFTQYGEKYAYNLVKRLKYVFAEIILEKLNSCKLKITKNYQKNECFNPYAFWLMCNSVQRSSIPEDVIKYIIDDVGVFLKGKDNQFKKDKIKVALLLTCIEKQTFYMPTVDYLGEYIWNEVCDQLDIYVNDLDIQTIIWDDSLVDGVKNYWVRTIQIIGDKRQILLYTLSSQEVKAAIVDGETKAILLIGLGYHLNCIDFKPNFIKASSCIRCAIPALVDYENLAVNEVPYGIYQLDIEKYNRCNSIISPFTHEEEKERKKLSRVQFVERVMSAETFEQLLRQFQLRMQISSLTKPCKDIR